MTNLKARVSQLEKDSFPPAPAWPLLVMESAPNLTQVTAEAVRQGRSVIVVSEIDARL